MPLLVVYDRQQAPHNSLVRIKPVMRCTALQVGGDDDALALVPGGERVEEQLAARAVEGHKAQLVDDEHVDAGQPTLEPAQLALVSGLDESTDEVRRSLLRRSRETTRLCSPKPTHPARGADDLHVTATMHAGGPPLASLTTLLVPAMIIEALGTRTSEVWAHGFSPASSLSVLPQVVPASPARG